ncbi:hypothetical protein ACS0TY_002448 [Phlomoides rotata]
MRESNLESSTSMDIPRRSPPPPSGGGNNAIRAAIMVIVVAVLAGYLFLWVVVPTNPYKQLWLPELRAKTASTFFGTHQGATYLIFTLPVLFIALLGCVYLHLGKRTRTNNHFERWEAKLETVALRLGIVGNIALTFLFFPVTRSSSVLPLLGLTSEASIKYHIWLGHIAMTLFTAHGFCYFLFWAFTHELSQIVKWEKTGVSNVAGELSLLAGLVLWATTFPKIRRKMFELFFYTHHLYILFVLFFALHVGISYTSIMLPGFFLFMIDRFLRFLQSRRHVRLVSARVLPCATIELNFSKTKGLCYTPTSIIFLNVPSISKMQWHPFTISSSSSLENDKVSVIIKGEGEWSNKLYETLASPSPIDRLDVSIEGPYGPASTNFLRHNLLVMVSGGSGITPFISIMRDLAHTSETQKRQIPEILLITAFKNSADLTMLDLILPSSSSPSHLSNLRLQIEAYITQEKQPTMQEKNTIRTIWFKPITSDAPLTPILGQNSWLWLAAIISSSFIIYLVFIAILTRYYIYPIDHNTNKIYPSPSRTLLHILFICIGIVVTSSTVFLWTKTENTKETTQIQNMEGATPVVSPNSLCYNADRELESLPQQLITQSINVHYGERPDLKRFLFEVKEASVGVMVCGPKEMRHEVANICSSGLADNLHFESISFSW